jgi:hypothetical protein
LVGLTFVVLWRDLRWVSVQVRSVVRGEGLQKMKWIVSLGGTRRDGDQVQRLEVGPGGLLMEMLHTLPSYHALNLLLVLLHPVLKVLVISIVDLVATCFYSHWLLSLGLLPLDFQPELLVPQLVL